MKKFARILILVALSAAHLVWIVDTGTHYMDDVMTFGRLFFPWLLPYALFAATLSFLLGYSRTEKACALALFGVVAFAIAQTVNIRVDGDRYHLILAIRGAFQFGHSLAPWLLVGLCFHQMLVAVWKREHYFGRWLIPLTGFALGYAGLGYVYIASRIHPAFPLSSSLPDAILVFCLGSLFFGLLWIQVLWLYDAPASVLPFSVKRANNQRSHAHAKPAVGSVRMTPSLKNELRD
jgi:hypothetical protein